MSLNDKLPETPDETIERLTSELDAFKSLTKEMNEEAISFHHSAKGTLPQIRILLEKAVGPIIMNAAVKYYQDKLDDLQKDFERSSQSRPADKQEAEDIRQDQIGMVDYKFLLELRLEVLEKFREPLSTDMRASLKNSKDTPLSGLFKYSDDIRSLFVGSSRDMSRYMDRCGREVSAELYGLLGPRTFKNFVSQTAGYISALKDSEDHSNSWLMKCEKLSDSGYNPSSFGGDKNDEMNLTELISRAQSPLEARLKKKNLNFVNHFSKKDAYKALGRKVILENDILKNLYCNAVKFSNNNSLIETNLSFTEDHLQIEVKDHGSGVPKHVLSEIFNPTKKTTTLGTSGEIGTGNGLPSARTHLEAWGGSIQCETNHNPKDGSSPYTIFKITLPRADVDILIDLDDMEDIEFVDDSEAA